MPTPTYDFLFGATTSFSTYSATFNTALDYRDLVLVIRIKSSSGSSTDNLRLFFEFDEVNLNKSYVTMTGNGTTATAESLTGQQYIKIMNCRTSASGNTEDSLIIINLNDYKQGDKFRTILWRKNDQNGVSAGVGRQNTAPTSSYTLSFQFDNGNIVSGSRFEVYGIRG